MKNTLQLVNAFLLGDHAIWRKLLEWHFDLFGWIDAGLAIKAPATDPTTLAE